MDAGQVVLLNGAPSVGKSSIARALQAALPTPYYYLGLDEYRAGYTHAAWDVDDGTLFRRMVEVYLMNLAALSRAGHHVISESMLTRDNERLYLDGFAGLPVVFVGLQCSLEVAQAREAARGDRRRGRIDLDQPLWYELHDHGCYDLELDTSAATPSELADRIVQVLAHPPAPSAFDRLRARVQQSG